MKHIYIVEDDVQVREELKSLLENNGYACSAMEQFDDALGQLLQAGADLVLLDIVLPHLDGVSLLKEFRKASAVPVIMVTSKNTEMDELLCMSYGADDFIAKPYHPSILLLHIEAVCKRMQPAEAVLEYKGVALDVSRGVLQAGEGSVELSKNEMKILAYLMKHKGRIVSRDELIGYLWDSGEFIDDNTLTVNVNRVRRKLEEQGVEDFIKTKRGQGYLIG